MPPESTLRLFDGYTARQLIAPEHRDFLIERLLEEGDSNDLRWLVSVVPEDGLSQWLGRRGGRRLSGRCRGFWQLILDRAAGPVHPAAGDLWPQ